MTQTKIAKDYDSNERQKRIRAFEQAFKMVQSEKDFESGVMDKSKVVSLVFDQDNWGVIPKDLIKDTKHPAVKIEEYTEDTTTLTSETGSRVLLTTEYLHGIEEMTGYDLWDNPEHVLLNEKDEFPVVVQDPKSDGDFILAPRIAPDDWW